MDNRQSLVAIAVRPRVLNDVSRVDSRSTFMDQSVYQPSPEATAKLAKTLLHDLKNPSVY